MAKGSDRSDIEYVRGEIVARGAPDLVHSGCQKRLIVILSTRWRISIVCTPSPSSGCNSPRTSFAFPTSPCSRVRHRRSLVPDRPPLCVVEIVSRDYRYTELLQKLDEYHRWGVPHIWVVDPWLERLSVYDGSDLRQTPELGLPGTDRRITIGELIRGFKDVATA